jgi:hypothetical protein
LLSKIVRVTSPKQKRLLLQGGFKKKLNRPLCHFRTAAQNWLAGSETFFLMFFLDKKKKLSLRGEGYEKKI